MVNPLRGGLLTVLSALLFLGTALGARPAEAQELFVMTSNTDHAWLAQTIGGDLVETYTPHKGFQEPELTWVDEIFPSWIIRARRADLYIRYGLYADVWADTVIDSAGNPKIRRGEPGYLDPTGGFEVLEIPTGPVDRRMGDLHVYGNPHYLLDPHNAIPVSEKILDALVRLRPDRAEMFQRNHRRFLERLNAKLEEWARRAEPLRGKNLATYHRTWSYFATRYGIDVVGVIEPKPGIEPTPSDLEGLIRAMKTQRTPVLIKAPVYSDEWPDYVAEQLDYPLEIRTLGAHVGGDEGVDSYFDLFDYLIDNLLAAYAAAAANGN